MPCSKLSSTDFVWQWASVSFVADTLALICPLCVLCLTISACLNRLRSSFVSSHHFTLTFHNSLNPFHPHPHCVVSSSLQLGLKSLFRLDITSNELKGGNSTVVALYWECPAAGVKTVTIVSYRRSKTSQLWFNLLIVVLPAGVKTVTIVSDPKAHVVQLPHLLIVASPPPLLVWRQSLSVVIKKQSGVSQLQLNWHTSCVCTEQKYQQHNITCAYLHRFCVLFKPLSLFIHFDTASLKIE